MVSATKWSQSRELDWANNHQRIRFYPTVGGDSSWSAFGWAPQPLDGAVKLFNGMATGGLSGLGAFALPGASSIAKVAGAVLGIVGGVWLAKRNLES